MADLEIGNDSNLTTTLATTDRITITRAATGQKVATMTVAEFMKKCAEMIPAVSGESNGLFTPGLLSLAFQSSSLPLAGTNIIGDISNIPTGHGYYNNTGTSSSANVPGGSAGTYLRIVNRHNTVTLFFTHTYQFWWKINDEPCKMLMNVGK